jgi:hypothetical protein
MKRIHNDPTRGMELVCGAVAALILLWLFVGLMGCKTTKTATRTVTDTVRVVRIDSVAVSKDTETGNKQDEYTRITERYMPNWLTDTSLSWPSFPMYKNEWRYNDIERDTILFTEYIRTPPRLIERIVERGSSNSTWEKEHYDSIIRVAVDSLAATKTETVKVVEKWRMPWWWVLVIIAGLLGMFFIIYGKR